MQRAAAQTPTTDKKGNSNHRTPSRMPSGDLDCKNLLTLFLESVNRNLPKKLNDQNPSQAQHPPKSVRTKRMGNKKKHGKYNVGNYGDNMRNLILKKNRKFLIKCWHFFSVVIENFWLKINRKNQKKVNLDFIPFIMITHFKMKRIKLISKKNQWKSDNFT